MIVLLEDGQDALRPATVRLIDRIRARLCGRKLDLALAGGASPESSVALALRAQCLVQPVVRGELARSLERTLACHSGKALSGRIGVCGRRVADARRELETVVERLSAPAPVAAAGVARIRVLLSDGSGPLYQERSGVDLRSELIEAASALDLPAA